MISDTILGQLGGNRFATMTGANFFLCLERGLQFRLPRTRGFVRKGINSVKITLDPSDTYTMEFDKIGTNVKTIAKIPGVYADDLRRIFTEQTGLETSL